MNNDALKLTDVINERVAELIQIGFNAAARTALGQSPDLQAPMTIVEKRNGSYHRIPEGLLPEWTEYCQYIRRFEAADGSHPGDDLCRECDAQKAEEFFSGGKRTWEWYVCHAGLVDLAIPITVGGKVTAVFFGGQKRLRDNEEYNTLLCRRIDELVAKIPDLKRRHLRKLARGVPVLQEDEIREFARRLSEIVSYIADLARRNYEAQQAVAVMARFTEEYMVERRPLMQVLPEILQEVASFLSVDHVILLRTRVQNAIVSYPRISPSVEEQVDCAYGILEKLPSQTPAEASAVSFVEESTKPELLRHLGKTLGLSQLQSAFLKPVVFAAGGAGVFIYGNPEIADWERASDDMMRRRHEFIHDLSERLRGQIDMYELDQEKDDLMAEVTHRLKSPMQWLMSETSTMMPRLDSLKKWLPLNPQIAYSLEKIEHIVDFLDAQTRNYTIVATMDKEGVAYNMKKHPLGRLVDVCRAHYEHLAQTRGITISLSVDKECYHRSVFDWEQMQVAVNNLLDNAIKYSHCDQIVYVTCRRHKHRGAYIVQFSSFGIGIAKEEQDAIFQKFRRGEIMKDPRRFIPGTGIGLTVARRVARDHNGEVRLVECKQGPSRMGRGHKEEGWKVVFELAIPV